MGWLPENYRSEKIRRRAYQIWQAEGCPNGRDYDHWALAEREIQEEEGRPPPNQPMLPSERPSARQ